MIQGIFTKGYIDLNQKIVKKYNPKKIRYARLLNSLSSEESLKKLFHSLKNSPKQKQLLMGVFEKQS